MSKWWVSFWGNHSKPSSSTSLDRTRKRSASMHGLDALGCAECKGQGRGTRQTDPPYLKPPMTGCRLTRHHCFHRMRPDHSQPQRDANPVEHVSGVERERSEEHSDHIYSERRASFWRLHSARSIRSEPLAQPKMPFGNLLVPESVE